MSARAKKRGRPMAFTAGSPLVGRQVKRAGKSPGPTPSPGPPGSKGVAALALATDESDIVLDRLGKEIVTLLKEGGSKKDVVRRRLRLGINEVTKFLEATAAAAGAAAASCNRPPSSSSTTTASSRSSRREDTGLPLPTSPTRPSGIVLFCRDVRPSRLAEHIHALVALTATPYLVLSGSSSSLGRVFGCKTMAAMAICPARTPPPPPAPLPDSPPSPIGGRGRGKAEGAGVEAGGGGVGGVTGGDGIEAEDGEGGVRGGSGVRDGESDASAAEAEGGRQDGDAVEDRGTVQVGGVGEKKEREEAREESLGRMDGSATGTEGGSDDRARAAEDVNSFIEFLTRKVKVRAPS